MRSILLTLLLAGAGGAAAHWLGFPSDWLVGAMLLVALCSMRGLATRVPRHSLELVQLVLGLSVGLRVNTELPAGASLLISLGGLLLCLATQLPLVQGLLRRLGWSREEAMLAASPGALSVMAALASELDNPLRVVLSQTVRVMLLISGVTLVLWLGWVNQVPLPGEQALSHGLSLLLLAAALLLGRGLRRLRLPVSPLLGGMLVGGVFAAQQPQGMVLAGWMLPLSMLLLGALLGCRIRPLPARELAGLLGIGLVICLASSLVSLLWAGLVAWQLDMSVFQVWLAYAPGGLEAMIYLALVTGEEPSWVIFHHVVRIVLLSLGGGWLMQRYQARAAAPDKGD
ncbi:AbrB family transcriptional regulator [Zobellella sp. An-6]|uniref:AbrB family transcriptional regulator n=1 Tax=Zobellella sp. An-6 TaxID=3400218 RepID=UPI0040427736